MTAPPPPWGAPPQQRQPTGSPVATVLAQLVLWPGLLVVAVTYRPISRFFLLHLDSVPRDVFTGVLAAYSALPIALALVVAGRGTTLRLAAVLGGVALLAGVVVANVVHVFGASPLLATALGVLGLGSWIAVRRHAPLGYLVLVPAAVLAYLYFGSPGLDLRAYPYLHRFGTVGLVLWNDLPVVGLAVLGLVSSWVRPRPSPARDGLAFAVVGGLIVLTAAAGVVAAIVS